MLEICEFQTFETKRHVEFLKGRVKIWAILRIRARKIRARIIRARIIRARKIRARKIRARIIRARIIRALKEFGL